MTDPLAELQRTLALVEQQISALEESADPAQSETLSALKAQHRVLVARLTGSGAIAQGGSTAVGTGGIYIGGNVQGSTFHLAPGSATPGAAPATPSASGGTWPESLPPELLERLREALPPCGPFDSPQELRDLFVDARLAPWRHALPEALSTTARVNAFLRLLYEQRGEDGTPALVPFLQVLGERARPGDGCRARMAALAAEVAALAE